MLKPGGALHVTCSTPPVFTPGAVPRYVEMAVADPAEFFPQNRETVGLFHRTKNAAKTRSTRSTKSLVLVVLVVLVVSTT